VPGPGGGLTAESALPTLMSHTLGRIGACLGCSPVWRLEGGEQWSNRQKTFGGQKGRSSRRAAGRL